MSKYQSREEKILANKNLVHHVLKSYSIRPDDYDDVAQIGMIGLIKAVDTFDEGRKFAFATYASRVIHNEVKMYFRSNKKYAKDISTNIVIGESSKEELTLEEAIPDTELTTSERVEGRQYIEYIINIILNYFSRREAVVFLYLMAGATQEEIARQLQISRSYASRIVGKIRRRLNEYVEKAEEHNRRGFFVEYSSVGFEVMFSITDLSAFIRSYQIALSSNTRVQQEAKSEFQVAHEGNKVIISFPIDFSMDFEYFSLLADIFWEAEEFAEKFQDYREKVRQDEREKKREEARLKSEQARQEREEARLKSEQARQKKEEDRLKSEQARQEKKETRLKSEQARQKEEAILKIEQAMQARKEAKLKRKEKNNEKIPRKKKQKSRESTTKKFQRKLPSGTKTARIRNYALAQGEFKTSELKRVFSDIPLATLNYAIQSMKKNGLIESTGYGKYNVVKSEAGEEN